MRLRSRMRQLMRVIQDVLMYSTSSVDNSEFADCNM